MPQYTDGTGRTLTIHQAPRRIVSLVPSQSELLYDLGLEESVVGITKFCIHPEAWFRTKERVGGTKNLHLDRIHALQPDLIIANKEENVREQVESLMPHFPVWVTDVRDLESALQMIRRVGQITGTAERAEILAERVIAGLSGVSRQAERMQRQRMAAGLPSAPTVAYLIWKDPYLSVGGDSFIHQMLLLCGLSNVFGNQNRYPEISMEALQAVRPNYLLLSSEPYPFKQKHAGELSALLPQTTILLVDGEMFSWYGSRLLKAGDYLKNFIGQLMP